VLTEGEGNLARAGGNFALQGTIDDQGQIVITGEGQRPEVGAFKARYSGRFAGDAFRAGGSVYAVSDPSKARSCTIEARLVRRAGQSAAAAAPAVQQAAAPAPAAAPASRALAPGALDGVWQGSYACGASNRGGQPGFDSPGRVFTVSGGKLSGRFSNNRGTSEEFTGSVAADGTITIQGNGVDGGNGRSYVIELQGKVEDGRLTAKGRHGDRDCTLNYAKIR
jgi:hypothetical protein